MTRDHEERRLSPTLKRNPIHGSPTKGILVSSMVVSAGVLAMAPPSSRAAAAAAVSTTQPSRNSVEAANNLRRMAEPAFVLASLVLAVLAIATFLIIRFRRVAQGAGSRRTPPLSATRPAPAGPADRQSRVVPFPPSADEVPEWQPSEGQETGAVAAAGSPPVIAGPAPVEVAVAEQAPAHKPIRLKPAESGHAPVPVAASMPPPRVQPAPLREAGTGTATAAVASPEPGAPAGFPTPSATESLVPSSQGLPPLPKLKLTMSPVPKTVVHVTPAMEFGSKRVRQSA